MRLAQDELKISSEALINEEMKNLKIAAAKKGGDHSDLMMIDERLQNLSKADAERLKQSLNK